ncbi:MAG: hypothetical protein ACI8TF_001634 [Paracoccaceae bacterium]|jgi:hypothetical protein
MAQLRRDMQFAPDWFDQKIISISLGHNPAFYVDIASDYFGRLIEEGVTFVPLEQALTGKPQAAVGSVVSGDFLVLPQKLAKASGQPAP